MGFLVGKYYNRIFSENFGISLPILPQSFHHFSSYSSIDLGWYKKKIFYGHSTKVYGLTRPEKTNNSSGWFKKKSGNMISFEVYSSGI
jgi:hypothetical protein